VNVNWKVLPMDGVAQVAPTPFRHPLAKLAGAPLAEVTVWNAESWLVQTTVLFVPITIFNEDGEYPKRVVLPAAYPEYGVPAPAVMLTGTQALGVAEQSTAGIVELLVLVEVCFAATSN